MAATKSISESASEVPTTNNASTSTTSHSTDTKSILDLRTRYGQFMFVVITIAISTLIPFLPRSALQSMYGRPLSTSTGTTGPSTIQPEEHNHPTFWTFQKGKSESHLKHVFAVLERLGIEKGSNTSATDWDLLWAHDYPFRALYPHLHRLKEHQLVNHFPGSGYLTNKVDLATTDIKYIPKAFKLPKDREAFRQYVASNPTKMFVQKHNQHRHIFVRNTTEIDFNDSETFVQEFVQPPLLVDGHKFDIGVYVTVTSVDPLRVYIYKGDILFRYCPLQYYPFDATQLDKYVVGDDYMPTWEIPSLVKSYNTLGYGMKGAFDAYIRGTGRNPDDIWTQVEDAIRLAVLAKEKHIVEALKLFPRKNNFFEMMRFDLGVDSDLNVFLMEANMSPNLSSAHFLQNQLLYEQVLYNLMQLVGVGSPLQRSSFKKSSPSVRAMQSSTKNLVVDAHICSAIPCLESCAPVQCQLCLPCMSSDDLGSLHSAYLEHMRKGDHKRIFPNVDMSEADVEQLTHKNRLASRWFKRKCEADATWCS